MKFRTFSKIKVNGKEAEPLYTFLKSAVRNDGREEASEKIMDKIRSIGRTSNAIKWNFTKFLVDREGNVVARYEPAVKPEEIEEPVEALLSK